MIVMFVSLNVGSFIIAWMVAHSALITLILILVVMYNYCPLQFNTTTFACYIHVKLAV